MALVLGHAHLVEGSRRVDGREHLGLAELGQVVVGVPDGEGIRHCETVETTEIHTPSNGVRRAVSNFLLDRHQREGPG